MHRIAIRLLFFSLLVLPTNAKAQDQPTSADTSSAAVASTQPVRDAAATALLEKAIAALGGKATASLVTDSVTTGAIGAPPDSKAPSRTFVWKLAGEEFRREFQGVSDLEVLVSGHGQAQSTRSGKNRRVFHHVVAASPPFHLPALVLLQELANADYSLTMVGTAAVQGRPAAVVRMVLGSDEVSRAVTPELWFFDLETGLPLRVEYRMPDNLNALKTVEASVELSDYRSVQGMLVPFRMVLAQAGDGPWTVTVRSVEFNTSLSPTEFDAQDGGDL